VSELPLFLFRGDWEGPWMGGRNGGLMGKREQEKQKRKRKNKVVEMPLKDGGGNVEEAGGDGAKEAGAKKGAAKKTGKGGKKALRKAVNEAIKEDCDSFVGQLVDHAGVGDMDCAEMVVSLMDKEKKEDGEDDDWEGPSLVEMLAAPRGKAENRE